MSFIKNEKTVIGKKVAIVQKLILEREKDFEVYFKKLVYGLGAIYPEKKYGICEIVKLVQNDQMPISGVRSWYADNLVDQTDKILDMTPKTNLECDHEMICVLPGITIKTFMLRKSNTDSDKMKDRNREATPIIIECLPRLLMWSQMLERIKFSRQDLVTLDHIVAESYSMEKNWHNKTEHVHRELSTTTLNQNSMNVQFGRQQRSLFNDGPIISPMLCTGIKFFVNSSGLGNTILEMEQFNTMISKATDEKIAAESENLRNFLNAVGIKKYVTAGGVRSDIAIRSSLTVKYEAPDMQHLTEEKEKPGRVISSITRKIPIVRFNPTPDEMKHYISHPGCKTGKNAAGDNVIVLTVSGQEELERELALGGRSWATRQIIIPIISYTTTAPEELTDEAVDNLEANGRDTISTWKIIDESKLTKEIEASDIASEVMIRVMHTVRELPNDMAPIDRLLKTFNALGAEFKEIPRYSNFSIRDVFITIMAYAKNEPIVLANPKLAAAVDRIQEYAANLASSSTVIVPSTEGQVAVKYDGSDLKETREIVLMLFDASGNSEQKHIDLVDRCIKCYVNFKNDEFDMKELTSIVDIGGADDFFNTDIAAEMIVNSGYIASN
jgi:hypothetical protein